MWDVAGDADPRAARRPQRAVNRLPRCRPTGGRSTPRAPTRSSRSWDLAGDRRLDRRFPAGPSMDFDDGSPKGLAVSPDGRTVAVTQMDGSVELRDARTLTVRRSARVLDGAALAVAYAADGKLLAVTGDGGRVLLRDARTLAAGERAAGTARRRSPWALAISPTDGASRSACALAGGGARRATCSSGTSAPESPSAAARRSGARVSLQSGRPAARRGRCSRATPSFVAATTVGAWRASGR